MPASEGRAHASRSHRHGKGLGPARHAERQWPQPQPLPPPPPTPSAPTAPLPACPPSARWRTSASHVAPDVVPSTRPHVHVRQVDRAAQPRERDDETERRVLVRHGAHLGRRSKLLRVARPAEPPHDVSREHLELPHRKRLRRVGPRRGAAVPPPRAVAAVGEAALRKGRRLVCADHGTRREGRRAGRRLVRRRISLGCADRPVALERRGSVALERRGSVAAGFCGAGAAGSSGASPHSPPSPWLRSRSCGSAACRARRATEATGGSCRRRSSRPAPVTAHRLCQAAAMRRAATTRRPCQCSPPSSSHPLRRREG